jgi:hypothetical protein
MFGISRLMEPLTYLNNLGIYDSPISKFEYKSDDDRALYVFLGRFYICMNACG